MSLLGTRPGNDERVDLYALPPEEFTAARDAAAKEDRSLKALRRPSVSAWVVNTLTREQPDLLQQLVELGAQLREATQAQQGGELRALTEQRHQLVQAVTEQAVGLVGRPISQAVRTEVAQTLEAAMADPRSAVAVQSGQLVRALSYAGFGDVDLEGAVADVPPPAPKADVSKKLQKLEAAALDAQGALDDAVRLAERTTRAFDAAQEESDAASEDVTTAEERAQELRDQLKAAEQSLQEARSRHSAARKELEDLQRKAERATTAVAEAQEKWDAARTALDEARRG